MTRSARKPDPEVVDRLSRGATLDGHTVTYADRLAAIRHLAAHGFTDQQIADRVGRTRRTVLRVRTEHHIPGQPLGTNRFTRRRDPGQNGPRSNPQREVTA